MTAPDITQLTLRQRIFGPLSLDRNGASQSAAGQEAKGAHRNGRDIRLPTLEHLKWNTDTEIEQSLEQLYKYADGTAETAVNWYLRRKASQQRGSRWLRLATILLVTLGGLIPILAGLDLPLGRALSGQTGYLVLALAAASLLLDKFFGFSTSWMRYVSAEEELQAATARFRLEWNLQLASLPEADARAARVGHMIAFARDFVVFVNQRVQQETQAWMTEFQSSLAEIDKLTKARSDAAQPGAIEILVSNRDKLGGDVRVDLDRHEYGRLDGPRYDIMHVSPGLHEVGVRARLSGAAVSDSTLVSVASEAVTHVELMPQLSAANDGGDAQPTDGSGGATPAG